MRITRSLYFLLVLIDLNLCDIQMKRFVVGLFGVLRRFQHCTGHIMTGSWKGRGNQYIQLVKVLYCKLPTNSKQLPAFPLEVGPGTKPESQRWEARVLPLCHRGPRLVVGDRLQKGFKMCLIISTVIVHNQEAKSLQWKGTLTTKHIFH